MSLAESPPELPYPKLPFWDAVSFAYWTFFTNLIDVLRASWLWLIVTAAVTSVASWQQWSWMATAMANLVPGHPPTPTPTGTTLLMAFNNVLLIFAGVSIAVAWHRRMILNERPGFSGSNVATGNLWRYVLVGVALCAILFLPLVAALITGSIVVSGAKAGGPLPPAFTPILLATFAVYAATIAITLRLSLLLPARAIGNTGLTFKQTWNRTRGNTWRLLWGIVITTVPPLLLAQIAFLVGIGAPIPAVVRGENFVTQMTAASTAMVAYYLLMLPISIGFLSNAYRHFFEAPLELPY